MHKAPLGFRQVPAADGPVYALWPLGYGSAAHEGLLSLLYRMGGISWINWNMQVLCMAMITLRVSTPYGHFERVLGSVSNASFLTVQDNNVSTRVV